MRRAYKILASIGMVALSTAVGLGVRHFVAVRKRRKGQDGCDAPEHVDETVAEAQDQDEAEDDAEDTEADDHEAEDAEAEDSEEEEDSEDKDDGEADDGAEEDAEAESDATEEDIAAISEDGEVIEADTEIHPDTVASADDAEASQSET